jgi:hypothetical protein
MPPAGAAVPVYPSSSAPSVSPDKRRRNLFIIIGALVIGACVCCGLCVVGSGSMLFKALRERGPVEKTVDQFMNAMAAKDAN